MSSISISGYAGMSNVSLTASGDANHVDIFGDDGTDSVNLSVDGPRGNRSISGSIGQESVSLTHSGQDLSGTFGDNFVSVQENGNINNESYDGNLAGTVSGNVNGSGVSGFCGNQMVSATSSGIIPDLDVLDYLVALSPRG